MHFLFEQKKYIMYLGVKQLLRHIMAEVLLQMMLDNIINNPQSTPVQMLFICTCARPTLCDSMDYSPAGSSVRGILQARILEWLAMCSSTRIFPIQGSNSWLLHLLHWQPPFTTSATWEASFSDSCFLCSCSSSRPAPTKVPELALNGLDWVTC